MPIYYPAYIEYIILPEHILTIDQGHGIGI